MRNWEPQRALPLPLAEEADASLEALSAPARGLVRQEIPFAGASLPLLMGEFWTSMQRQGSNLHEISYRACYKPQLPRLFIEHLTEPGDLVYDPFSGRGTTAIEAALLGRRVAANDVNPLSRMLAEPRLSPPDLQALSLRLEEIPLSEAAPDGTDLDMFYHPQTEAEIRALRTWFMGREAAGTFDELDAWIRMVATNRLTGHSPGFFSVYTLPPNQAVSAEKQRILNERRRQVPPYRDTHSLLLRKSRQLLKGLTDVERRRLSCASEDARFLTGDARSVPSIPSGAVALTVTSPPFLDVVNYAKDNWLRCWFCGLDAETIGKGITMARTVEAWSEVMGEVFQELYRITRPGGYVAFEVGEVRQGQIRLEEAVLPLGHAARFEPLGVLVNEQDFTKTANIWGVSNNTHGTNSNRIVLFRKEPE